MTTATDVVVKTFLLRKDGLVLVIKRSDSDNMRPGSWDIPGGGADDNEDFVGTAAREILEETGIAIDPSAFELCYSIAEIKDYTNIVRLGFIVRKGIYGEVKT